MNNEIYLNPSSLKIRGLFKAHNYNPSKILCWNR